MKILIVGDVPNWAIGGLIKSVIKHLPYINWKEVYVGPRDVKEKSGEFMKVVKEFKPDIIHWHYYRTASQMIELNPELKSYKNILTHHNQRDKALFEKDWNREMGIRWLTSHTARCKELLELRGNQVNVTQIPHGIDLDYFTYSGDEVNEDVVGYCGRIVPWKRLDAVSDAVDGLGYKLEVMGRPDKLDYWETVNKKPLLFSYFNCKDDERINFYRNIKVFVNFADDGYEEGPLPLLEAMATGVPVISTPSGIAPEIIQDGVNGYLVDFNDTEALKQRIKELMENKDLRDKFRKGAWETIKTRTEEKMALQYSNLYHKVNQPDFELVSVIIPTYNRKELVGKTLDKLQEQTYPNFEVVICDDNSNDGTREVIEAKRREVGYTLKYVNTNSEGYNLAKARNLGIIEAEGEYLVFMDSRFLPEEDAIMSFKVACENAKKLNDEGNRKVWFFGNKGSAKQDFVENFSGVKRDLLIEAGMFCERIDEYGGMTQEIRSRWKRQGGGFQYNQGARCIELISSKKDEDKRKSIVKMKTRLYKMFGEKRI